MSDAMNRPRPVSASSLPTVAVRPDPRAVGVGTVRVGKLDRLGFEPRRRDRLRETKRHRQPPRAAARRAARSARRTSSTPGSAARTASCRSGGTIEEEEPAAAGARDLSADGAAGQGPLVAGVDVVRRDRARQAALRAPALVEQRAELLRARSRSAAAGRGIARPCRASGSACRWCADVALAARAARLPHRAVCRSRTA